MNLKLDNSDASDIIKLVSLAHDIQNLLSNNKYLVTTKNKDIINIKTFETRKIFVDKLKNILGQIPVVTEIVEKILCRSAASHEHDISAIENIKTSENNIYTLVSKKKCFKPLINQELCISNHIFITPYIKINAKIVQNFDSVGNDLCYVKPNNHFAIRISGVLFHGNIGIIYVDEKVPSKLKECKFSSMCTKMSQCDYYHDPVKYNASKDCRNYAVTSFTYSPQKNRGRKFGSRDKIATDLPNMSADDISIYTDQCMHDILCAIILNNSH